MPKKPTPALTLQAESSDRATVNWSDGAARYHVWASRKADGWHVESVAYKNPPLASDGRPMRTDAPGYFETRRIDLDAKAHTALAAAVRELATAEALDSVTAEFSGKQAAQWAAERKAARLASIRKAAALLATASPEEMEEAAGPRETETRDESGRVFIDMTPTWESLAGTFAMLLQNGDAKGRATALAEIQRMGKIADSAVLQSRAAKAAELA